MASSTSRASAAGWKRRVTPAAAKWRSFPPRTGGSAKAAKCWTRALRGTRPGCESVTDCGRDRKPLDAAALDRVRQKPAGAHFSKSRVDHLKAVGTIEWYGHGLWHAVEVVLQHP